MNIKKHGPLISILCAVGSMAYGAAPSEYSKLTRENLPGAQAVVEASLDYLSFDQRTIKEHRRLARLANLLPQLMLKATLDQSQVPQYEYGDYYNRNDKNTTEVDQYRIKGYGDRMRYDAYAEWDMAQLVHSDYDNVLGAAKTTQSDQEHFLLVEISKRYAALWKLLPEEKGVRVSASKALDILEHASVLDALSGSLISQALAEKEGDGVEIYRNEKGLQRIVKESKKPEEEVVILLDVDDGDDDTVEKAGQ